jgi:hypothetical protein
MSLYKPNPWAENHKYAAAPAQSTKVVPPLGRQLEGHTIEELVPPTEWNFREWQYRRAIQDAHSMRQLNWFQSETASYIIPSPRRVTVGGYCPFTLDTGGTVRDIHTVMLQETVAPTVAPTEAISWGPQVAITPISLGGLIWRTVSTSLPIAVFNDFDADNQGNRVVIMGNNDGVYLSTIIGTWVQWPPGFATSPLIYTRAAYGHSGWVFYDSTGLAYFAANTSSQIAGAASDPGFGTAITQVTHSKHDPGLLWPDDLGNRVYMAVSSTKYSTTTNGSDWSSSAPHVAPTSPLDLGYSAYGTRWIMPLTDTTSGPMSLWISKDNGLSWEIRSGVVPTTADAITAKIASDGSGNWILAVTNEDADPTLEHFASWDNGDSWHKIYVSPEHYRFNFYLWYGGGRFHLATSDDPDPDADVRFYHSLRGGE